MKHFQYCYQPHPHRTTPIDGETQYQRPLYSRSGEIYRFTLQLRPDDRILLANIPLSRRNFEVKFKHAMNTSIYQYILNCRVDHLADLLLTTNRPLARHRNRRRIQRLQQYLAYFQEIQRVFSSGIP